MLMVSCIPKSEEPTTARTSMQIRLRDGALYRYCSEQSISRDELARRMGVASTTAYRVECGDVEPSPRFIAARMHTCGWFEQD